jgi:hypothetical protein
MEDMFGERATDGDRSQLAFLKGEVERLKESAEKGKEAKL